MKKTIIVILFFVVVSNLQSQDKNSNITEKNFMLYLSFGTSTYPFHTPAKEQSSFEFGFREIGLKYTLPTKIYFGVSYYHDAYPVGYGKAVIEPGEIETLEYSYFHHSSLNLSSGYFFNSYLSGGVKLGYFISDERYSLIINSAYRIIDKNNTGLMLEPEIKFSVGRYSSSSSGTHFGLNAVFYFGL